MLNPSTIGPPEENIQPGSPNVDEFADQVPVDESNPPPIVLLDFWATWCGPCKAAMPIMQRLHEAYRDKGVAVVGVSTWEKDSQAATDYFSKKRFTYGCLLGGDDLAEAYGVTGIPTLVVIGKDGKVEKIETGIGPDGEKNLRMVIDGALVK